jgi:hypothetical protein
MTPRSNALRLLAGLIALTLVLPCLAQEPASTGSGTQRPTSDPTPYGQRTDAFRRLLYDLQFQPVTSFVQLQADPRASILIVLGDPSCLSRDHFPEGLKPFVRQGGAVLIATDKEIEGEARKMLIELAGVTVTGQTLLGLSPNSLYNGNAYCPVVEPLADTSSLDLPANVVGALAASIGAGGRPDLFRNPHPNGPELRVATNAPSCLQEQSWWLPGGIQRLARLPAPCAEETSGNEQPRRPLRGSGTRRGPGSATNAPPPRGEENAVRILLINPPLFAVGGSLGEGRVLVLADHSIFINRMILPRDTGNLEFTANCLHWLRGGAMSTADVLRAMRSQGGAEQLLGQRNKVFFWDDGVIRSDFHVAMKEVPIHPKIPSTPALIAAFDQAFTRSADQYLTRQQQSNALNRGLLEALDEHGWTTTSLRRSGVYLLTFVLLALLGYRFVWRGRYQLDTATPLLGRAVAQHEPKASLIEQRRRSLLRAGNVWETAHQLARQCFESAGVPLTVSTMPRIAVQGSWWHRWRVRRRVARLWELAQGTAPARIPPAALPRWIRDLDELKSALATGTIRFQIDDC